MINNWIQRITGQPAQQANLAGLSTLRQVIGEADEDADEKPDKPDKSDSAPSAEPEPSSAPAIAEPKEEPEAAVDADIEAGADASADTRIDSPVVAHLVSSWKSGSRMDVASELMYTAVNYTDFVKMLFRIGEQGGIELGGMLDELSEVRPSIDQPGGEIDPEAEAEGPGQPQGSAGRILSRIAQQRSPAQPAGDTTLEPDAAP